jgi:hypothetical protein
VGLVVTWCGVRASPADKDFYLAEKKFLACGEEIFSLQKRVFYRVATKYILAGGGGGCLKCMVS